jgi:hypothetical protein
MACLVALLTASGAACYSAGDGVAPPTKNFYFPTGLAVSQGGNVLYAINSDFDLQYNGGTLQSYDLFQIRQHALLAIANPDDPRLPLVRRPTSAETRRCPGVTPGLKDDDSGERQPFGETCAPPVDSTGYVRDSVTIGAFAAGLSLSRFGTRLFAPLRGSTALTWADVAQDDPSAVPTSSYPSFVIDCGARVDGRCDSAHDAGNDPNEAANTRGILLPGEPFGMAESEDGQSIVLTHQSETKTSLFTTGFRRGQSTESPALQFVVDGVAIGGSGVAAIPYDVDAFDPCVPRSDGSPCLDGVPRPAFLQTSRSKGVLTRVRYYSDQGAGAPSSLYRPFLVREAEQPIVANASGADSRGIVIDPSPRLRCKSAVAPADPNGSPARTDAMVAAENRECARVPARLFIASRSPASLLVGEVGQGASSADGTYDPDTVRIHRSVPLPSGPSRLYLAPVVNGDGRLAIRVFAVCFDASQVIVFDPDAGVIENVVRVGPGPYAMAFDPFTLEGAALGAQVPLDDRQTVAPIRRYRFAYVASFTRSYVQLVDLDNAGRSSPTYQRIVFTLGNPTLPKGS